MDRLTRSHLKSLAMHCEEHCVSIFMPLHPGSEQVRQDYTRLDNLVNEARAALEARGVDPDPILAPIAEFVDDLDTFRQPGRGLALFLAGGSLQAYRTRFALDEGVFVNGRFMIRPLLAATHDEQFYLVAISKHRVRLFSGDTGALYELHVPDLPSGGLDDVPQGDRVYPETQQHTAGPRPAGARAPAAFHSQRDTDTGQLETVARLCRATADALRSAMFESARPPIVIVGDGRLAHDLARIGQLDPVIGVVDGNPDELEAWELLDRARPLVEAHVAAQQRAEADRFHEALHHQLGAADLGSIVTAANDGRVDVLFVDTRSACWGRFDPARRDVVTHARPEPGDDDLIDLAASLTLAHGGEVVGHVPEEIRDESAAAAIFRHRLTGAQASA